MRTIVLDLDETMVKSLIDPGNMEILNKTGLLTDPQLRDVKSRLYYLTLHDVGFKKGTGNKEQGWGLFRPGYNEFLRFILNHYEVIVWSAGDYSYVQDVTARLFAGQAKNPAKILTRNDCVGKHRYKPLSILETKDRRLEDIIIIDNKPNVTGDFDANQILIPDFEPDRETLDSINKWLSMGAREDDAFRKIRKWLEAHPTGDVRTLPKDIF